MSLRKRLGMGLVLIACNSAQAVEVNTMYLDDMPDNNRRVLTLNNESQVTQFIQVEIAKLQGAERTLIDANSKQVVVANPGAFTLLPSQKRSIRVTPLFDRDDEEHQYLVTVKPVISPKEAALNKVKAVAAYGVRYIYRPRDPVVDFGFERTPKGVELVNQGNTSVLIIGAVACPGEQAQPNQCESLKSIRVAPKSSELVSNSPALNQKLIVGEYQVAGKISEKRTDKIAN